VNEGHGNRGQVRGSSRVGRPPQRQGTVGRELNPRHAARRSQAEGGLPRLSPPKKNRSPSPRGGLGRGASAGARLWQGAGERRGGRGGPPQPRASNGDATGRDQDGRSQWFHAARGPVFGLAGKENRQGVPRAKNQAGGRPATCRPREPGRGMARSRDNAGVSKVAASKGGLPGSGWVTVLMLRLGQGPFRRPVSLGSTTSPGSNR